MRVCCLWLPTCCRPLTKCHLLLLPPSPAGQEKPTTAAPQLRDASSTVELGAADAVQDPSPGEEVTNATADTAAGQMTNKCPWCPVTRNTPDDLPELEVAIAADKLETIMKQMIFQ